MEIVDERMRALNLGYRLGTYYKRTAKLRGFREHRRMTLLDIGVDRNVGGTLTRKFLRSSATAVATDSVTVWVSMQPKARPGYRE